MKRRGWIILGAVVLVASIALPIGIPRWRDAVRARRAAETLAQARAAHGEERYHDARALLFGRQPPASLADDWDRLTRDVCVALRDLPGLDALRRRRPVLVGEHEGAALLIGRYFAQSKQASKLEALSREWDGRKTKPAAWLALEVDAMIRAGRRADAIALLEEQRLPGKDDCGRLLRLAVLQLPTDSRTAWGHLNAAVVANPRHPDARLYRAQFLEGLKRPAMARLEYMAAVRAQPDNPLLRDQLAEFYRRQGKVAAALETWASTFGTEGLPSAIPIKVWFWSRVARPGAALQGEPRSPLERVLRALPATRFWDDAAFEAVPEARAGARRQEIYWLRLLDALARGDETRAAELAARRPFEGPVFHADLLHALVRVLRFRRDGVLEPLGRIDTPHPRATAHRFFVDLDDAARHRDVPEPLARFLRSDGAFAGCVLAAGWLEAGVRIHRAVERAPAWYGYAHVQALRETRGFEAALAAVERAPDAPAVRLLHGEILAGLGRTTEAVARWTPLATADSDVGYRAAWLCALAALDADEPLTAAARVAGQPRLARDPAGRALLARCALAQGDEARAESLYAEIAKGSSEARIYLARQAFARRDWAAARTHTEALLLAYPDSLQLRANLQAIEEAENS